MAAANPVEEQISCSVCLEVYQDPHVLRECLHTFCHPCIGQLEKNGRVECPECRTISLKDNIKRDFKTQSFIDAVNSQRLNIRSTGLGASVISNTANIRSTEPGTIVISNTANIRGTEPGTSVISNTANIRGTEPGTSAISNTANVGNCSMCMQRSRCAKYHCKECEQFMCEECQITHKGMKLCQTHTVRSVHEIFQDSETLIKKLIKDIENEKKDISTETLTIDEDIDKIRTLEVKQIQDVEKYSEGIIKDVQDNEKRLKQMIREANDSVVTSLEERKRLFNKSQDELQAKIDFLENLLKKQDMNALTESVENIKLNMIESVDQIKAALPCKVLSKPPVNVHKGADLDIQGCIQVTIDGSLYGSQEVKPVLQSLFSDLCKNEYVQSDEVRFDFVAFKLAEVDNEIWCCGFGAGGVSHIKVYNQQCQEVNTLTPHKLKYINSFCVTPRKEIIVSCDDGLQKLDIQGTCQDLVARGGFSDVCYHEGQLYALEFRESNVMIFSQSTDYKWHLKSNIQLKNHINADSFDRLCIHNTGLYISFFWNNCIFVYNFKGQLLQRAGQGDSRLCVCDVSDSVGNILVSDCSNSQIKLYSKETGWRVVPVTGKIDNPRSALIDKQGNIWVGNYNEKLLKFVRK